MKPIVYLMFLCVMRLSYSAELTSCDEPIDDIGVAELIIDRCEDFSKKNVKDLINNIEFDDDSDGPGYLNINIFYKKERIGYHVLLEKYPYDGKCFYEDALEVSCPQRL